MLYIALFCLALQLGNTNILNGDLEFFYPGSYMIVAEDFTFVYNSSSSNGMDAAFISGPLSEQLFIGVCYRNFVSSLVSIVNTVCRCIVLMLVHIQLVGNTRSVVLHCHQ